MSDKALGPVELAEAEKADIRKAAEADPDSHPYYNVNHPQHRSVRKRMTELYRITHPGTMPDD